MHIYSLLLLLLFAPSPGVFCPLTVLLCVGLDGIHSDYSVFSHSQHSFLRSVVPSHFQLFFYASLLFFFFISRLCPISGVVYSFLLLFFLRFSSSSSSPWSYASRTLRLLVLSLSHSRLTIATYVCEKATKCEVDARSPTAHRTRHIHSFNICLAMESFFGVCMYFTE